MGLTGIGGASLITPMLIFVFQVPPTVAISSDIVAATLMKVVGGWKHCQQKTLDWQVVRWLTAGSVLGSLSGIGILHTVKGATTLALDGILLRLISFILLSLTLMALAHLLLLTLAPGLQLRAIPKLKLDTWLGRTTTVVIGVILGCIVGLTSVSSGSLFAVVLIACFQLEANKLVGTDIVQAAILLGVTSLGHLSLGTVDWSLVVPIWIGSIPGVLFGARLCQFAPQRILRVGIYLLLIVASWSLAHAA